MRTLSLFTVCIIAASLFAGCGGSKSTPYSASEGKIPAWYNTPPQDPNFLFAPSTATSQDMQLAVDKAATAARAEIGRQAEVKIQALQKRFDEETGMGQDAQMLQMFTQATKTVVSSTLTGTRIKNQEQFQDGGTWRAYVLVEYPIGAAHAALLQQIKANEQMYTRFRSGQTFKELEENAQKYEQSKTEQGK